MDLIKSVSRRTRFGEVVYIVLNVIYAATVLGLVIAFDPPYLAFIVILISKWRVFAVRPRFWVANMQANLGDLLVALSVVTVLWHNNGSLSIQVGLTVLFAIWLLVIKPRSKRFWILLQAGIIQFVSLVALFSVGYIMPASVIVIAAWLVGYVSARHALTAFKDESERTLLSLIWGVVSAEFAWLSYHWTIAYTLSENLKVPQVAVIIALLSFAAVKLYSSQRENEGKFDSKEVRWPIIFVSVAIGLLVLRFSGLDVTQL